MGKASSLLCKLLVGTSRVSYLSRLASGMSCLRFSGLVAYVRTIHAVCSCRVSSDQRYLHVCFTESLIEILSLFSVSFTFCSLHQSSDSCGHAHICAIDPIAATHSSGSFVQANYKKAQPFF
jgi:hypothetical protein